MIYCFVQTYVKGTSLHVVFAQLRIRWEHEDIVRMMTPMGIILIRKDDDIFEPTIKILDPTTTISMEIHKYNESMMMYFPSRP